MPLRQDTDCKVANHVAQVSMVKDLRTENYYAMRVHLASFPIYHPLAVNQTVYLAQTTNMHPQILLLVCPVRRIVRRMTSTGRTTIANATVAMRPSIPCPVRLVMLEPIRTRSQMKHAPIVRWARTCPIKRRSVLRSAKRAAIPSMPLLEANFVTIAPITATACFPARLAKIVIATQDTTEPMARPVMHAQEAPSNQIPDTFHVCLVPAASIPMPLQPRQARHVLRAPRPHMQTLEARIAHHVHPTVTPGRVGAISKTASATAATQAQMVGHAKLVRLANLKCASETLNVLSVALDHTQKREARNMRVNASAVHLAWSPIHQNLIVNTV